MTDGGRSALLDLLSKWESAAANFRGALRSGFEERTTLIYTKRAEVFELCVKGLRDALAGLPVPQSSEVEALKARVNRWRAWAQFVYLGGGPVQIEDDAELQKAVCVAQDARESVLKAEALGAGLPVPAEPPRCLHTGNPCGTDTWQVGRPCECANCQKYLAQEPSIDPRFVATFAEGKAVAVAPPPQENQETPEEKRQLDEAFYDLMNTKPDTEDDDPAVAPPHPHTEQK